MVLNSSLSSGINCAGNFFIYYKTAHLRLAYYKEGSFILMFYPKLDQGHLGMSEPVKVGSE